MADGGYRDNRAEVVTETPAGKVATIESEVRGLNWASEKAVVERVLGRRPGVRLVEANPVAQTATVTFRHRHGVGCGTEAVGQGMRLPLRQPVRALPCLPSDG